MIHFVVIRTQVLLAFIFQLSIHGKFLLVIDLQVLQVMIRLNRRQYLVNPRQGCHTALIRIPNGKSLWKIQVKAPKSVLLLSDKVIVFCVCPNQDNH